MFTTKIPNVKVASATVYSNTCKNVLLIHLYRIETKKECNVSFKPSHFPFKIQTKLDNSSIINFSYISLCQDVKRK